MDYIMLLKEHRAHLVVYGTEAQFEEMISNQGLRQENQLRDNVQNENNE